MWKEQAIGNILEIALEGFKYLMVVIQDGQV